MPAGPFGYDPVQLRSVRHAHGISRKARFRRQVGPADQPAQPFEDRIGIAGDQHESAVCGAVGVGGGCRGDRAASRLLHLAKLSIFREHRLHHAEHTVGQGHIQAAADAIAPAPVKTPAPTTRLAALAAELTRLRRYSLIIVDEVGYLPFEQDAANLFFQLVSSRYEHASLILTSNLPFSGWGGVFGDQAVAAAMIDRVVHHADVLTLKGASYRLRNRGIDTLPSIKTQDTAD